MDETEEISVLWFSNVRIECCKCGKVILNDFRYESCIQWIFPVIDDQINVQARITMCRRFLLQESDCLLKYRGFLFRWLHCVFYLSGLRRWLFGGLTHRAQLLNAHLK